MESDKPGIVSILAAATVDSDKPRVSISAARAVAAAARADSFLLTRTLSGSFSSSSGSFPIRAPLTIDEDDDDSGSVSDEHTSASSYSNGLDSGTDDGFESISGDADDETELEDVLMGGIRVHRELVEETGDLSVFSGPVADDIDEETSVNYSSLDEESENSDDIDGLSEAERVSVKAKVVIPRAILSLDDDEFDEILGSDDEEAALLRRVTKSRSDEEPEVEDSVLQSGDEPECLESFRGDVVSTEEEAMSLDDGLMSFGNIEESNDFMVANEESTIEAGLGLSLSFKQLFEKEDGSGSENEFEASMKQSDAESVEDSAVELADMGMTDKPECSGSVTGELFSTDEDMLQEKSSHDGLVSFESSLGVVLGDCNEFVLETEGNAVNNDSKLYETVSHLIEQGMGQGSISKESSNSTDVGSSCETDESLVQGKGSVGSGSRDSGDEDAENMVSEGKEDCGNDCESVCELEKTECEDEHETATSCEIFHSTPVLDSVTTSNFEVAGGIDVVNGCDSFDKKAEQEAENEGKQGSEDIDRKLSLPDEEDRESSSRSSFEVANQSVDNGKQVNFQSDNEVNQIAVRIEDVERTLPENSSFIDCDIMENEMQMAGLIHNHTIMELDEHEGTSDTREKLSESPFQKNSVQLISEKVKERVEKTQLLKEKLQRIIRSTDICSENLAVTEAVSKLSLAGGEHQTSLELDYVSDRTKIMLPEQEFPDNLDFSVNILVIGKTGVGKSATINSIFGETKSAVGAFGVTTKSSNYVVGNVGGIQIKILDTPGLKSSATEECFNQEVLMSIKKSMRKFPVDVILYIDRLDQHLDIHLLRNITSSLGSSVWRNTIVVLTHAASDVPDSSSYKNFIAQRCSHMHQSIREAVPELSCESKMPGIVLVENNMSSLCGNRTTESSCPDWRLNLLILCCSVKIRSKSSSLQKQNIVIEKTSVFGSQLCSFTLFCSLWNVLLLGASSGHTSHSNDVLEEKKRRLLDSYPNILWDEQRQECVEQETVILKNQEPEDKERRYGKGTVLGRVRTKRGRIGFQATKRFGIYLDTSDLHTGFSIGSRGCRKNEQEEGKILVRMRGSVSVLGLVPMLVSVFTSFYGGKYT